MLTRILFISLALSALLVFSATAGTLEDAYNADQAGEYKKAFDIWFVEASQGNGIAQYNLGVMYETGRGVSKDLKEAVRWYRIAAENGVPSAQLNLGFLYVQGLGTDQDNAAAYAWWLLAAENNNETAKNNLTEAVEKMTDEEIEKGKNFAREIQERMKK